MTPTALFHELGSFQGLCCDSLQRYDALFSDAATRFLVRGEAENNADYKQLIPYVIFSYVHEGERSLFTYCRGSHAGESRLRSKLSIGVGGHINESDSHNAQSGSDLFNACVRREISEETTITADILSFRRVALVNDDSTPVGRVHLGVICLAELSAPEMTANEPDLVDARFRPLSELREILLAHPDAFESWSTLALQGIFND